MTIGDDLKADVDALRDELGLDCTLNGVTALGKCAYRELMPGEARSLGADYEDEIDVPWALFEAAAGSTIKEGDTIVPTLTAETWIVRRILTTQASGVKIADRLLCTRKLV